MWVTSSLALAIVGLIYATPTDATNGEYENLQLRTLKITDSTVAQKLSVIWIDWYTSFGAYTPPKNPYFGKTELAKKV